MINSNRVCVILPSFNEAIPVLNSVLRKISERNYFIVLIDDGSEIHLRDKLDRLGQFEGALITHLVNLGQGAAIETGFEYVRRNRGRFDYILTFDADGQHPVESIEPMILKMAQNQVDVILGTRFKPNESFRDFKGGFTKFIILKFAARLARLTLGISVSDRHNGFRLFSAEALGRIHITQNGFGHADEILRNIRNQNLTHQEMYVEITYSQYSKAKGQPLINAYQTIFDRFLGAN